MPKNKYKILNLLILMCFTFFIGYKLGYAADCDSMKKTFGIINELIGLLKISVPVLLILLGTIDFVKATVAKDDDQMKKAQSDFIKRLIYGVIIFFVPSILRFVLELVGFGGGYLDCINF